MCVHTPTRSLLRIQQLAKEQDAALLAGNVEELCRLTEMLPNALADLQNAAAHSPLTAQHSPLIEVIRLAHERAERYLEKEMQDVRGMLQQYGTARSTLRAYGKPRSNVQLDNRG